MSIYTYNNSSINSGALSQTETDLYGSSRLGMLKPNINVQSSLAGPAIGTKYITTFTRGNKIFELSNHLGNVLVTVSDKKIPVAKATPNQAQVSYYTADVLSASDYYPFGMSMPRRDSTFSGSYRYKFNGKEVDKDIQGADYDYGFRIYDPRTGKFLSVDPLIKKYPSWSSYSFAMNCPISGVDLDGLEYYYTADGSLLGVLGNNTEVRVVNDKNIASVKKSFENQKFFRGNFPLTTLEVNMKSQPLGITNETLIAFAAVIDNESSGNKEESYIIGNTTMNYVAGGGAPGLTKLDDIVFYDNSFAQGATQDNYTSFIGKTHDQQNLKYAMAAAINAIGYSKGIEGFSDHSNNANAWDGIDLISTLYDNTHRNYTWSENSKNLLLTYKTNNNGGVDVSKFKYSVTEFDISATKIRGKTLYEHVEGPRGEHKQNSNKFTAPTSSTLLTPIQ